MINSNNTQRNSDHDFTKLRKRILGNQGGVESKEQFIFDNDTKKLSAGSDIATAYILCTRPASNPIPNQKFLAQFEFTGSLDFLNITNGDKIFIEIKENLVNDPTLIEDLDSQTSYNQGLGIGEIKIAKNYPSHSNYLKLYEWNEGKLVDLRKAISLPALDEVAQRTTTLEQKATQAAEKIEKLEEGNWADHLEFRSLFWDREKNVTPAEEVVFVKQKLPAYEFSNLELNLGKDAADKEIHIQRFSSGIPSDEISFKLKKVQLPITNIEVEVRKGVVVDVDAENCYWYGGELLASGVVMNNKLGEEYWRIGIKLNKKISLPKGGLYSVVLRQAGGVVNAVNYYQIGCDTTQRSTAFWAVKVNGGARTPTRWMAFCDSEAFLEESVVLYRPQNDQEVYSIARMGDYNSGEGETIEFICPIDNPLISFRNATSGSYWMVTGFYFIQNGKRFPINRNRPPQKVLLKRWTVKLCLEGYRSHIVEIKLMFNANSEGLKVIGKHGTRYTLGESYGFGLAGFFNDKRIGPQIDTANPTTSATTGTIAPGNYVSYLTVIGPDGKKYKIWAYAE